MVGYGDDVGAPLSIKGNLESHRPTLGQAAASGRPEDLAGLRLCAGCSVRPCPHTNGDGAVLLTWQIGLRAAERRIVVQRHALDAARRLTEVAKPSRRPALGPEAEAPPVHAWEGHVRAILWGRHLALGPLHSRAEHPANCLQIGETLLNTGLEHGALSPFVPGLDHHNAVRVDSVLGPGERPLEQLGCAAHPSQILVLGPGPPVPSGHDCGPETAVREPSPVLPQPPALLDEVLIAHLGVLAARTRYR